MLSNDKAQRIISIRFLLHFLPVQTHSYEDVKLIPKSSTTGFIYIKLCKSANHRETLDMDEFLQSQIKL